MAKYKFVMRITIVLFLLVMCFVNIKGQKSDSIFNFIGHRIYNGIQPKLITNFDDLPQEIKVVTLDFIKRRLVDYSLKIKFVDAQIFAVDFLFDEDIEALQENNANINLIPYYDLYYSFRDDSLGISQYVINIGIDKFGQIISCNFPQQQLGRKIISLEKAIYYSDSLSQAKYPTFKIGKRKVSLDYNHVEDNLIWEICYLTPFDGNKGYCFQINAHTFQFINELYMMADVFDNITPCNCQVSEPVIEYRK